MKYCKVDLVPIQTQFLLDITLYYNYNKSVLYNRYLINNLPILLRSILASAYSTSAPASASYLEWLSRLITMVLNPDKLFDDIDFY